MDYVTFVEALRKRQVLQEMGSAGRPKALNEIYRRLDWAIPNYDFGSQFYSPGRKTGPALDFSRMFLQWMAERPVRLPFPEVVFLLEGPRHHFAVRAQEEDDGYFVLLTFARRKDGGPIVRWPVAIRFRRHPTSDSLGSYAPDIALAIEEGAEGVGGDVTMKWARGMIFDTMICSFALVAAKPDGEFLAATEAETISLESANRGRVSAGLNPLPATKVLTVRFNALDKLVWRKREGSHSPKAPHIRRGHERRYPDGKVLWIEATSVKGGAAPKPFTVDVEL
ncbi:hypothetical protein [Microvirga sp. P5_D2]